MNAAFLLVTTACLAGAEIADPKPADPKPADPKPIVVTPAPAPCNGCGGGATMAYGGGGACCDPCQGGEREGLLGRLRNRFKRGDDCCDPCQGGDHGGLFGRLRNRGGHDCGCDDGRPGLLERLRARFHRGGDCCDSCGGGAMAAPAAGCCGGAAPGMPMQKIETVPAPKGNGDPGKKLPPGGDAGKQVQVVPRGAPPVLQVAPTKTDSPF